MEEYTTSCLAPSFLPATAVLELTYKCNHKCQFCSCPWYAEAFPMEEELSIEEWKKIIKKLSRMGVCNFAFTGGEPLLKEGFEELIEFAATQKCDLIETEDGVLKRQDVPPNLYLLSNGKIMSDEVIDLCAKNSVHLSMSLPGLDTFSEHTGGGRAKNVLRWFKEASAKGVKTTAGITVTKKNIHELYETMAEALLAGAGSILLNRFMPGGRGLEYAKELVLDRNDILLMLETAEEVLQKANRNGNVGTELPLCCIGEKKYEKLKVGTKCSAALEFFVIGPSGYCRVCNHSPVQLVHVNEIEKLKDHSYWRSFVLKDYLPKECFDCESMGDCDGGCREAANVLHGKIDAPDPLLC